MGSPSANGTLMPCPYIVGATFLLRVSPPAGSPFRAHITVQHAYTPFTISPVMRVSLDSVDDAQVPLDLPSEMVLKVYNRRFSPTLRKQHRAKPATYESEEIYLQHLTSGEAPEWEAIGDAIKATGKRLRDCPAELLEHYMMFRMEPYFEDECAAYQRLAGLQGRDIPIFYGTTQFLDGLPIPDLDPPVPGILLEVIPGTPLDAVDPTSVDIDALIRNAMRIVDSYSEIGVLNEDVRLGNFIVKPNESVVMIDFAHSWLREDENDQERRSEK
ncbi:hypothetical protein FRC07_010980 [Ceratobasidium sp. 392]|nr:hypothetical protein FRC07_010980 [Ceratobasidium sp. 392]